jgi:hypothetical protein
MAGHQAGNRVRVGPFDLNDDLNADEWMARRNAQVAQRGRAELAGRQAWANSIRTGQSVNASQPGHLRTIGMQALSGQPVRTSPGHGYNPDEPRDEHGRWTTGGATTSPGHPAPQSPQTISYGSLSAPAPSSQELAELRRQQAAMAAIRNKIDIENSWFAAPALAAPLVVLGLEGAAALAARGALPAIERASLDFVEREPYLRVGDNWATRIGRRAHAALKQQVESKEGWEPEPKLNRPGKAPLRPDAGTPKRNPAHPTNPGKRYYLELKPNTPSGRAAAARAVKRYKTVTEDKVRPVYYDPKDFK